MSSRRAVVLMAVLLLLLAGYLARPFLQELYDERKGTGLAAAPGAAKPGAVTPPPAQPLPATNALSNLTVERNERGNWVASVEYAYTGQPPNAYLVLSQVVTTEMQAAQEMKNSSMALRPGRARVLIPINNPDPSQMYVTQKVAARLEAPFGGKSLITVSVDHRIQWPDPAKAEVEQAIAAGKPEAIIQKAVEWIDSGHEYQLKDARRLLQALVDQSPRTEMAYVELARVAMKTNWNSSGLREAEALINSALQIKPDSANAKVLLGYVYAHQGRYKEAEALLAQAAAANPPNLWLWANWGEVLVMQGKLDAGIAKYREAIQRPPTRDTYDRARQDAYENLLQLLQQRQDLGGMEALYKQRMQDYPGIECFSVEYARFLVLPRNDPAGAHAVLRQFSAPACPEPRKQLVEGLVRYVAWAQGSPGPDKADLLRQARVFHPVSPSLFYELASSEHGVPVARQLLAAGERIGMQDERKLDALAYALRRGETSIARRLLQMGASPLAEVGHEKMPVALLPVLSRDVASIRLMRRAGVDYTKLRYQGTTAVEHARQQGDAKLLEALDPKSGKV